MSITAQPVTFNQGLPEKMTFSHRLNLDIHKFVAKIVQGCGTIIFRVLFNSLFKVEIIGREKIAAEHGPVIIVSNHVVFFDSFMFHLFFAPNASLLPLRFLGTMKFDSQPIMNVFSKIGIIQLIYLLFGVSVVTEGDGLAKNLRNPIEILKRGGTITIFPSGQLHSDNSLGQFKRGAAALAQLTDTPIIPVALKRFRQKGSRTRFTIMVGDKFTVEPQQSYDQATLSIREKVEELHNKIS